jgi:uncharacterized protein YchJ
MQAEQTQHDKNNVIKGIFACHERPFLVFESYCDDPECECNTVILTFVETSPQFEPIPGAMEFAIGLSVKDWQFEILHNPQASTEVVGDILKEFRRDLTTPLKERLQKRHQNVRAFARRALKFNLSDDEILSGAMRGYWEVFDESGRVFSFEFKHEDQRYLIVDQYCLNPTCDCQTVSLAFATTDESEKSAQDVFAIFVDLKMKYQVEFSTIPKKKVRQIVAAWLQHQPDVREIIAYRYKKMKEVGRLALERSHQQEIAQQEAARLNIGRNAPCPCGSGKKYKKCCGR